MRGRTTLTDNLIRDNSKNINIPNKINKKAIKVEGIKCTASNIDISILPRFTRATPQL